MFVVHGFGWFGVNVCHCVVKFSGLHFVLYSQSYTLLSPVNNNAGPLLHVADPMLLLTSKVEHCFNGLEHAVISCVVYWL